MMTFGEFIDQKGAFTDKRLKTNDRGALIDKLLTLFAKDRDAGLHAAMEWLLRKLLPKLHESKRIEEAVAGLKQNESEVQARKPLPGRMVR